jgi:RimJ/RimL family protein N-acetyltransferase
MTSDLELLALEIETQWTADERGRMLHTRELNSRPAPLMVVAASGQEHVVAFGREVPDGLVTELEAAMAGAFAPETAVPEPLTRCAEILEREVGPVAVSSGPSYVIPPGTAFPSDVPIVRSSDKDAEDLRNLSPLRGGWSDGEWKLLIDGALGPWAMAISDSEIVSICHCARLSERGAEAGVWTDADHRGRGYAAAVTAAWASLLEASGRTLFYSTSAKNVSSQRVAARLGLRPIGWLWNAA